MEGVWIGVLLVSCLAVALGLWLMSRPLDTDRITDQVQQKGGRVSSISWAPSGGGGPREKNRRIYKVVYYDEAGDQHLATCKTSIWRGLNWTEDHVTHDKSTWNQALSPGGEPGKPPAGQAPKAPREDPADELRRLREENERLRRELARRGG